MNPYEQMNEIRKSIASVQDPAILFVINQRYRELEMQIKAIENMVVIVG